MPKYTAEEQQKVDAAPRLNLTEYATKGPLPIKIYGVAKGTYIDKDGVVTVTSDTNHCGQPPNSIRIAPNELLTF